METQYRGVVDRYFEAKNAHNTDKVVECFADDAVVHDEGKEHRGKAAIRSWSDSVIARYNLSLKVLDVSEEDAHTMHATAEVSGTFDGSPATLGYRFRFASNGLISSLEAS